MNTAKHVLVPIDSLKAVIRHIEICGLPWAPSIRKHMMALVSATGIEGRTKSRTLHAINLYDEEKIGRYYVARDTEGMLRVHNGTSFHGYIQKYPTRKWPMAFKVRLFLTNNAEKTKTCEFLQQAENYLQKQVRAAQSIK